MDFALAGPFATAAIVIVTIAAPLIFLHTQQNKKSSIPLVRSWSSWIPFLGCTPEYFSSIVLFMEKYGRKHGNAFQAPIMGRQWYLLLDPQDAMKVFRTPEKKMSFARGIQIMTGGLLPVEFNDGQRASSIVRKAIFRNKQGEGLSGVPIFVHALKNLPMWGPWLREAFQHNFKHFLPSKEGTQDLFEWCRELIAIGTARVMLGGRGGESGEGIHVSIVEQWVKLVHECDIESALTGSGAINSLKAFGEVFFFGERQVYRKARAFIYPYIDKEIENYLADKPENGSVIAAFVRNIGSILDGKSNRDHLSEAKIRIANDLITFTFAAITNSYGTSAWCLYHIIRNTEGYGDLVRKELLNPSTPALESPALERLILEVTRVYTPGNSFRYTCVDFQLDSDPNMVIPAGSMVGMNVALTVRNPKAYAHPTKFSPGRFLPGDKDHQVGEYGVNGYFPGFGMGAHPCVGKKFAMNEIAIFVTEAFRSFEIGLLGEQVPSNTFPKAAELTERMVTNVPNHPLLNPSQAGSVWRPLHPVQIKYKWKM